MNTKAIMNSENSSRGLSLLYMYIGAGLISEYGIEGEAAVRRALAGFAVQRGEDLRKTHLSLGMKTNLYNFAKYYNGGYDEDTATEGSFYEVDPCRDSHDTTFCPFVKEMIDRGHRELAVAYCEEVHPPLWQSYAPTAIVNLGRTLAQEGSDRCYFDIFLRPARMTAEQRKECFEEYDPDFKGDRHEEYRFPTHSESSKQQTVFMLKSLASEAQKAFGEDSLGCVKKAISAYLDDYLATLRASAEENGLAFDEDFMRKNCLFAMSMEEDAGYWDRYGTPGLKALADRSIYAPLREKYRSMAE
ncbi:MAG: L-2-amino-thiazoline-4-carboxylic acid hydrolase [Firmicutes bacterium]|nr:L-2-amino-thiazoline-4-carboxylic acid hydrolase [Bacillota bacterium]